MESANDMNSNNRTPALPEADRNQILILASDPGHRSRITLRDVRAAIWHAGANIHHDGDLFLFLCAVNLLNAAVKTDEFKEHIDQQFIKGHVTRVLRYLVTRNGRGFDAEFYINPDERCAYVESGGFQFSFHHAGNPAAFREFLESGRNRPRPWSGIRLQKVAGELFRYALSLDGPPDSPGRSGRSQEGRFGQMRIRIG